MERQDFTCHPDSGRSSLLYPEDEDKYIKVGTISLDDFIEEKRVLPDVIKMDVEAAEPHVLQGMKRLLEAKESLMLFVEYALSSDYVFKVLEGKGFKVYFITRDLAT